MFEAAFEGPATGIPSSMSRSTSSSRHENREVAAPGFYDGEGVYRVRFMPDAEGEWTYRTRSNVAALNGLSRRVRCGAAGGGQSRPGPRAQPLPFRLCRRHALLPLRHHLLRLDAPAARRCSARRSRRCEPRGFNKLRMAVFPKHYAFNENEPLHDIYERRRRRRRSTSTGRTPSPSGTSRRRSPRLARPGHRGRHHHLPSLRPLGLLRRCRPSRTTRYVRYLAARLARLSQRLVVARQRIRLPARREAGRAMGPLSSTSSRRTIPARHLKSIHNGEETMNFDHRKPWVDHVCIQNWNVKRTAEWRDEWGKPIVNDELEYEGDISLAWGNITPQELVHRFWVTVTRGGYAGHGETYRASAGSAVVGEGRDLHGESWKRIAFLRSIIEEDVVNGLTPAPERMAVAARLDGERRRGAAHLFRRASAGALDRGPAHG